MKSYRLEKSELKTLHRRIREKRYADRLKAVILLGSGWLPEAVASALLIDRDTVRKYYKLYRSGGTECLLSMGYQGSQRALSDEQIDELDAHLQETLHQTAKAVIQFIQKRWDVTYSLSGITALVHELGYVYKKPKIVPGKADAQAQEDFLAAYEKLKKNQGKDDPIYFMDATHPHHIRSWLMAGSNAAQSEQYQATRDASA